MMHIQIVKWWDYRIETVSGEFDVVHVHIRFAENLFFKLIEYDESSSEEIILGFDKFTTFPRTLGCHCIKFSYPRLLSCMFYEF